MRMLSCSLFNWKVILLTSFIGLLCLQHMDLPRYNFSHKLHFNINATDEPMKYQKGSTAIGYWSTSTVHSKSTTATMDTTVLDDTSVMNSFKKFLNKVDEDNYEKGRNHEYLSDVEHSNYSAQTIGRKSIPNPRSKEGPLSIDTKLVESSNEKGKTWLTVFPARGRLGNQMFQIASLYGITHTFGYKPFIIPSTFDIDSIFSTKKFDAKRINISDFNKFEEKDANLFAERDITYYSDLSILKTGGNWSLDGYLQSFKYFKQINEEIRSIFTFREDIQSQVRTFIKSNTSHIKVKVGIHVRRGDFLSEYHKSIGRVIPEVGYYKRAMEFYTRKYTDVTFIVVSNDIQWCMDNLQDHQQTVIFSPFKDPGYDLAMMSQCDHAIISVGTFGWWGGWLANGTVIYFEGYPRPGSEISKYFVKEDFYPTEWIGMT